MPRQTTAINIATAPARSAAKKRPHTRTSIPGIHSTGLRACIESAPWLIGLPAHALMSPANAACGVIEGIKTSVSALPIMIEGTKTKGMTPSIMIKGTKTKGMAPSIMIEGIKTKEMSPSISSKPIFSCENSHPAPKSH